MYRFITALLAIGVSLDTVACRQVEPCAQTEPTRVVEVFTWWTQPGEREALGELVKVHQERYPDTKVIRSGMGRGELASDFLSVRMDPDLYRVPDTFQANIGWDLIRWTNGDESLSRLEQLEESKFGIHLFYPDVVAHARLEPEEDKGPLYGIPLDIHRTNTIYFNKGVIAGEGIAFEPDENGAITIAQFEQACDQFKKQREAAKDPKRFPIALGTLNSSWTLGILVHESLLPVIAGPDYYKNLWERDRADPNPLDDPTWPLQTTYQKVVAWKQLGYFDPDYRGLYWREALKKVLTGETLFYFMGDWATAELKAVKQSDNQRPEPGKDFDSVSLKPDNDSPAFVYTSDCFCLPRGARRPEADELLLTAASRDGQLGFSREKGSIPALDVSLDVLEGQGFNPMQIRTLRAFRDTDASKRLLAVSGLLEAPPGLGDLNGALVRMLDANDDMVMIDHWKDVYNDYRK